MGEQIVKLNDVGEGVAEAELVEWHVKVGDPVREDDIIAAVMTDKATIEIPSPVEGEVSWLGGEVGDTIAVGSPLAKIRTGSDASVAAAADDSKNAEAPPAGEPEQKQASGDSKAPEKQPDPAAEMPPERPKRQRPAKQDSALKTGGKPLASPAVRLRAREAGIDLRQVPGTGPAGRITHEDIDVFSQRGIQAPDAGLRRDTSVEDIKVTGMRRRIAEKMALAKSRIPHITYVEEVDVTALEDLRASLNRERKPDRAKLTILPFLMRAMVSAIADQPQINAIFDDEAGVVHRHGGVHIGVATQTDSGLMVPVVRHAEARDIWDSAAELVRLSESARTGTATRDELTGSTITITSLGAMGGIVTTPVINHPEVAIVGVNKIAVRPVWENNAFVPRKMMNLSSSFDHRVIDGWDAAVFVQRLKTLLENPAMLFVEG